MVLTAKSFLSWSQQEIAVLANKTIPEVSRIAGIDAKLPVLMGFSAGGQVAFLIWAQDAGNLGGLIINAAEPLDASQRAVLPLPQEPGFKSTPIFCIVGDKDSRCQFWKKLEDPWRKGGVPLTMRYVANQGHTWLIHGEEKAELEKWLDQVAAGKKSGMDAGKDKGL